MNKKCEHEWKYTGYYIDSFMDGYGIDVVFVEIKLKVMDITQNQ